MPELSVSPRFKQDLCLLFCIFFIKLILTLQTCSECISGPCFPLLLVHSLSFFATKQQPPFTQPAKLPALFLIPRASINAVLSKLLACLCYAAVSGALGHHSPFIWVFFFFTQEIASLHSTGYLIHNPLDSDDR